LIRIEPPVAAMSSPPNLRERNVVADRNADLIRAVRAGDLATARAVNAALIPLVAAVMRTSPGAVMAKTALAELGIIPHPTVRLPLLEAEPSHAAQLTATLAAIFAESAVA
jgi:4-hydroxy-tetrahydrodipicolinate synthase